MQRYFIGLMSGTSADGMDAVLIKMSGEHSLNTVASAFVPYSQEDRQDLRVAATATQLTWIEYKRLDQLVADVSIEAIKELVKNSGIEAQHITAIGSHGHTIRHYPSSDHLHGTSYQIGDPNRIAEATGITCIADFRRRDMAAGGEGAPLVPAFHQVCFGHTETPTMVLNIGGIANLSVLGEEVIGFDTGPGNTLMDEWCRVNLGQPRDEGGQLAAQGIVDQTLLNQLLSMPYFSAPPPKSTGRELFDLQNLPLPDLAVTDILATLTELTAESVKRAIENFGYAEGDLLVCGGGIHNHHLMERIAALLPNHRVSSTASRGIDPDWVEAIAFAWLAKQTIDGLPGNLTGVTGAKGSRILGGIYQG